MTRKKIIYWNHKIISKNKILILHSLGNHALNLNNSYRNTNPKIYDLLKILNLNV